MASRRFRNRSHQPTPWRRRPAKRWTRATRSSTGNPDASIRAWTLSGRSPDKVHALIDASGLPVEERGRSEEHTSEIQSPCNIVCRLLLEKKKKKTTVYHE